MAREYFCAFHSYLKSIEPLNEAERGRLFTALLEYSSTGIAPELRGNERFIFPTMKEQIDRDINNYNDFVKKQSNNGKKGGRPKSQPNPKNPPLFSETQKSLREGEDKEEDKEEGDKRERVCAQARTPAREQKTALAGKDAFGTFKNVLLTPEEYSAVVEKYGVSYVDEFSAKLEAGGYKSKNHYATMLLWAEQDKRQKPSEGSFDIDEFFEAAMNRKYEDFGKE